jgi:hypothetical protein
VEGALKAAGGRWANSRGSRAPSRRKAVHGHRRVGSLHPRRSNPHPASHRP